MMKIMLVEEEVELGGGSRVWRILIEYSDNLKE